MNQIEFTENDFNLTDEEIQVISDEAHNLLYPEQQQNFKLSLGNLQNLIKKDYQLIVSIINKKGQIDPHIEKMCLLRIFQHLTQLRTIFTGQEYILQVGLNSGETWESPLTGLFDESRGKLEIYNGNIQYHIDKVEKSINTIDNFNTSLQKLMNKLFTTSLGNGSKFIYQHSSGSTNEGVFWKSPNFAGYGTSSIAHYFISQNTGAFYTSSTAKYYNRGHVYEWYLSDINQLNNSNYNPQPLAFMKKHEKDNIAFLQAGDYTRVANKDDINNYTIQAVQVKRENNKKLISYTQLKNTLETLLKLCNEGVSQKLFKETIRKAFFSKDRILNKGALKQLNQMMKQLF